EGTSTAHVSVVDAAGNAASITCSIEQPYGSAVVVPGTGILLNNQLTDFDEPGTANEPRPGKRPRSSVTPVIVSTDGVPRLVAGGVGGPHLPSALLLAVSNVVDFEMDPALALDAARVDADTCCALFVEQHRVPQAERDSLRARGHTIVDDGQYRSWDPSVQLVGTEADGRTRFATSDPRNDRAAAVVVGP
ncbi:MAG: gamma-glutamyltransferase family protein, partial [Actinobacteria bacterium]|nr:gamma-glutamyltransferase family protein [Actinomycetota bacterium]